MPLNKIKNQAKLLPSLPGVYLFKNEENQILYIGKAKNLKNRVSSYFKNNKDWKTDSIIQSSNHLDHIVTKTELDAMLLEAELIQAHQPKFNILLKNGQPFLYLLITNPPQKLPELKIVRNQKEKGIFWGPFLEKTPALKVYNFLIKTFRLKLCKKKMENGCLEYHIGICAGACHPNFNKKAYLERLELAKLLLQKGHQKFLKHLKDEIEKHNKKLEFEKSKELHQYYTAFDKVFQSIDTDIISQKNTQDLAQKDIWFLTEDKKNLFLFSEQKSALKKKQVFHFPFIQNKQMYWDYFKSYYQSFNCPNTILINFDINKNEIKLFQNFLKKWHKKQFDISITKPTGGHLANLMNLAKIHVQQEIDKQKTTPKVLKQLLKLKTEPHTIDCFDISHKQGMWQVGSCIRFKDGQPDKNNFRKFKIKTIEQQNDYACLKEIVKRRYKDTNDLPNLILIDGGKGQLNSIQKLNLPIEIASLAKKEETVFSQNLSNGKKLNSQKYPSQLLIALRDYAHHFAINYHKKISLQEYNTCK